MIELYSVERQPIPLSLQLRSNNTLCTTVVWFHTGRIVRLQKREAPYGIVEGEEAEYLAWLTEFPSADVRLDVKSEDDRSVVKTPQLIFTQANWEEVQKILIFARDDDVIEDTPYYTKVQFNTSSTNDSLNVNLTIPLPILDADKGEQ